MGNIDQFTVRNMLQMVEILAEPFTPFQKWFFAGNEELSESEYVDLDEDDKGLQLANFVEPDATEKATEKQGWTTHSFRIPYLKPLMSIAPRELANRLPGEPIYNPGSPQSRFNRLLARTLGEIEGRIQRRIEWMCSQLVLNGTIPILDADGNTLRATITFPRAAATSPTSDWSSASADIIGDIRSWKQIAARLSGYIPDIAYCAGDVLTLMMENTAFTNLLDNRSGDFAQMTVEAQEIGVDYAGRILGIPLYVVSTQYKDQDGNAIELMTDGVFGMGSRRAQHQMIYGPIHDFNDNGDSIAAVTRRFPTSWIEKNPSVRQVQVHSAPLCFTKSWDSFITATVGGESESSS